MWKEYVEYIIKVGHLLPGLTLLPLAPTFQGTTISFIPEWLNKLKYYKDLTDADSNFPDNMKKALLQNTICNFDTLKSVKSAKQLEIAKGNRPIPCNKYVSLIWGVASAHKKL